MTALPDTPRQPEQYCHVGQADNRVNSLDLASQRLTHTLGQTSGHNDLADLTFFFCRTACRIASIASALAGAMKPQVLMTTTSARSGLPLRTKPNVDLPQHNFAVNDVFRTSSATKPTVTGLFVCFFYLASIILSESPDPIKKSLRMPHRFAGWRKNVNTSLIPEINLISKTY
jgi:hypothetical protein